MKVRVEEDGIHIECAGLELLKLKAQLAQRIGSQLTSGKDFITFPLSALPIVADLIGHAETDGEVENALERFKRHEAARIRALEIIELNEQPALSGNWNNVLEPAQASAVGAMTVPGLLGLCLFDEQGSGKTVMTIAAFDELRGLG